MPLLIRYGGLFLSGRGAGWLAYCRALRHHWTFAMTRAIARCLLFAALLLAGGCLEFDSQEVAIRCDAEKDRIDALFVYRGFYAEASKDQAGERVDKALKDLDEALQSGEFAFWCNWPFTVDLTREGTRPGAALMQHVEVENGGLFTDLKGALCGYQFVRVNGAKAFVQKLNTLLEVEAQGLLASGRGGHKFASDTRDLLREFLRSGEKMLTVEPGRIGLRIPCAAADHRWIKGQFESVLLSEMMPEMVRREGLAKFADQAGEPGAKKFHADSVEIRGSMLPERMRQSATFRFFWDNDIAFERQPEMTVIALGVKDSKELRIQKGSDGAYGEALKQAIEARGDKVEAGVPDQEIERRFTAFRERDAKLPPGLAALRKK